MLDTRQLHKHVVALEEGDDAARRQAIQALLHHSEQEWESVSNDVMQGLVKTLKIQLLKRTKQPQVQKEIATLLGNLGRHGKTAIPSLMELLQEGIPEPVREGAVAALGKMGKEARVAIDAIVKFIGNSRPALTTQAIRALGNIGCADERVRSALAKIWSLPIQFQGSQVQVALTLCKLQIPAPGLLALLTRNLVANQDASLRKSAAEALSWCNKNEIDVVPALLLASLNDSNDEVRLMAQGGLEHMRLSQAKAIQLCAKHLKESAYAEAALRKTGEHGVAALIEALESEEPEVRVKAARTLGSLGEIAVAAEPTLKAALREKNPEVRLAVSKSLWNITKKGDLVVPALIDLLKAKGIPDRDGGETRRRFLQTVVEALGRIGPPAAAAVSALTAMTQDPNRHIRESALTALHEIAPAAANKTGSRR